MADQKNTPIPKPQKRGSATLAKTIHNQRSPVRDPSVPVSIPTSGPPASAGPAIDTGTLLKAWSLNVETMRSLIEHMDGIKLDNAQTRSDAKLTRRITMGSTAMVFVLAMGGMYRLDAAIEQVQVLSVTAQATAKDVEVVHDQLAAVLSAVMAATAADVEEGIIKHEAAVAAAKAPRPTTARARRELAARVSLHKPSMVALKARLEAQAVALQAEHKLAAAEDTLPEQRAHTAVVRAKARKLKKRAAKLKISDDDSPLAGLDF